MKTGARSAPANIPGFSQIEVKPRLPLICCRGQGFQGGFVLRTAVYHFLQARYHARRVKVLPALPPGHSPRGNGRRRGPSRGGEGGGAGKRRARDRDGIPSEYGGSALGGLHIATTNDCLIWLGGLAWPGLAWRGLAWRGLVWGKAKPPQWVDPQTRMPRSDHYCFAIWRRPTMLTAATY
eukprot:gene14633-biopygen20114